MVPYTNIEGKSHGPEPLNPIHTTNKDPILIPSIREVLEHIMNPSRPEEDNSGNRDKKVNTTNYLLWTYVCQANFYTMNHAMAKKSNEQFCLHVENIRLEPYKTTDHCIPVGPCSTATNSYSPKILKPHSI